MTPNTSSTPPAGGNGEREYGVRGLFGIAVPQANPIVEPEFGALLPPGVSTIATRLQGSRTDSSNRLVQYLDNLGTSLDAYDTARPDALGYACTGSSYLVDPAMEARLLAEQESRVGYRIVTAASAILQALQHLGAARVALLAPYPEWLMKAGSRYWTAHGLAVVAESRSMIESDDTRHVYGIRSHQVEAAAQALDIGNADAVLISGTGMPTLRAIPRIALRTGKPVVSSNLCLAWALLKAHGADFPAPRHDRGETLIGGWADRAALL
ncbi:aspartate/glutamate racemase family protein [Bordetella sp. BOR01]|uniref:maleate cis-trans isomerase family protein n=1 Tax=Bordetella sp. BOR01 TaxID=2854779 RepID=UPI001C462191|nr:aspartate/glutamate racemase family protein [Bordetella sp. BOR01]MBV7483296.1 aspartate/glutamate racemase family protein [Bordetella sp. BOR01]